MTQNEVKTYIENLGAVERMKSNLDNLKIEWETDITKIDLSVLASEPQIPNVPGTQLKIEWVETSIIKGVIYSKEILKEGSIERFVELYKLIESEVKVIPPLVIREIEFVDGEIKETEQQKFISISDGAHRLSLSKHLKLAQIPVLVAEVPHKHYFTKSMWNVTYNESTIELTQKSGEKKCSLPLANSFGRLTESGDYLFYIHGVSL